MPLLFTPRSLRLVPCAFFPSSSSVLSPLCGRAASTAWSAAFIAITASLAACSAVSLIELVAPFPALAIAFAAEATRNLASAARWSAFLAAARRTDLFNGLRARTARAAALRRATRLPRRGGRARQRFGGLRTTLAFSPNLAARRLLGFWTLFRAGM